MGSGRRVLVTGALGCLGAWTIAALLDAGDEPIGFDLDDDRRRLRLVLGDSATAVTLVRGDVTDTRAVALALDEHEVTHVVHLAALQVPACRENPLLGARVNVLGTLAVFEAVRARRRIPGVAYASSAAVYGAHDPSPAPESGGTAPATHYGVFKLANEGAARVLWEEHGMASIGIRPYIVYGPGRDQGLTSDPTLAMAAAAAGKHYEIGFRGSAQYDYAPDVGRAFALAAHSAREGAAVANFPGMTCSVEDVIAAIEDAAPDATGRITSSGKPLPFLEALEADRLERLLGPLPLTPFRSGVRQTIAHFRSLRG